MPSSRLRLRLTADKMARRFWLARPGWADRTLTPNEPNCFRSGMTQPRDPARAASAPRQTKKTADPARRPRTPYGPVAAREWDVAHAAALRALLTQPLAVLPNRVGDPLLPLQIGIWDALLALLRPGAEPEALARALRAYTRSTGYFMACARKDAMRHDLDGRAVEPVSEEHRTGAVKAVQGRRSRSSGQKTVDDAGAQEARLVGLCRKHPRCSPPHGSSVELQPVNGPPEPPWRKRKTPARALRPRNGAAAAPSEQGAHPT